MSEGAPDIEILRLNPVKLSSPQVVDFHSELLAKARAKLVGQSVIPRPFGVPALRHKSGRFRGGPFAERRIQVDRVVAGPRVAPAAATAALLARREAPAVGAPLHGPVEDRHAEPLPQPHP